MLLTRGYAALTAQAPLAPFQFERREVGPRDVLVDVRFCGICRSDVHQARDEWGGALFPMVPGHEIAGTATQFGAGVTVFSHSRSKRDEAEKLGAEFVLTGEPSALSTRAGHFDLLLDTVSV